MSLDNFRKNILLNSGEERVEVNQRLLIDKILARYSAEFVVYRELMQNSDDAKSSSVQIIFESKKIIKNKFIPNPLNSFKKSSADIITRIMFKNNGFSFRLEDWNRLKKIAEGNPDEQKIGAFGVGFYSLFSICEEPFVTSGGKGMAFFWNGNQLFTKQGPTGDKDKVWTTFLMDMRDPVEFPNVEKFARFLANSLGFTRNLQEVSVYFNDTLVIQLSKNMKEPKSMKNITSKFDTFSPQKMFHLTSVNVRCVQLNIKRLLIPANMDAKQWNSLPITNFQMEETSILLKIASGNLDVKVNKAFSAELERITKKKPPSKTTIQTIFTGFDERNSSGNYNRNISPVIKDLLPYPEQGKLYIGFPTHQTTGCCSNLAAIVIPTVDRESIDLAEKTLVIYNSEMLSLGGTLCRILYEDEMSQITKLYKEQVSDAKANENTKSRFEKWAADALTHFTFRSSTPNAKVGSIIESQFFSCSKQKLFILSTNGVLPISDVRMPNPEMAGFIKNVPVVPKIIFEQCNTFFEKAKDMMKLIEALTFQDVLYELNSRTFSEYEMVELLKWWISYKSKGNIVNTNDYERFMQLACIGGKPLNTIRYFLNPGIIPPDVDIQAEVLPYTISKKLKNQDFKICFGWSELSLVDWARFIITKPDLENNPTYAKKVHQILAKSLNNTSQNDKKIICQLFVQKRCIPTNLGMKIPSEAYFQDVNIFPDLPTIQFERPFSVKNIMELLGVRKVVELEFIFNRLVNQGGQGGWDHMQLAKYLASMLSDLKENEIMILRDKPIWPKEQSSKNERLIASDLYIPTALHREFGLPVIDWKKGWSYNTQEGKFLMMLGLQEYPTLEKILKLAAHPTDVKIRNKALVYLIENFEKKYSKTYNPAQVNVAFLPCSDPNIYAKPLECYINPQCMIMNFHLIHQDLRFQVERFGVCQHPSREKLLQRLIDDPPLHENKAKAIFEYLASRQADFINSDWEILADLKFIPIRNKFQHNNIILINPRSCYLKVEKVLNDFFLCIDFGNTANLFLQRCGVKVTPSPIELAELLLNSSCELFKSVKIEKYFHILKLIAINFSILANKPSLIAGMRQAPILLGLKDSPETRNSKDCFLASAKEIFINDNPAYQRIFNTLIAPDDDCFMEILYKELGCRSLHESVVEIVKPIGSTRETKNSQEFKEKISERASLFYSDHKDKIKRDVEWLKMLKVREVDEMETIYKLDANSVIKKGFTTACILQDRCANSWTLYVSPDPDPLDISNQIVKEIYTSHMWKDVFCLNVLLTAELSNLERRGYPVDHIRKQRDSRNIVKQNQQSFVENEKNEKPVIVVTPETTQNLRNSLRNTIKTCNSNVGNINSINSKPNATFIKESQSSYCDIIPGHLLYNVGIIREIKIYDTKDISQSDILNQYNAPLNRFINMLKDLANVFEIMPKVIHIFYDQNSNSIAFNFNGALFFNLKFYIGLHDDECKFNPTSNAMTYWFMTLCHELAHNYIMPHSSEHEYYLSSFAEIYMSNFFEIMKKRGILC